MMTIMTNKMKENLECPYCNNTYDVCMASFASLKLDKLVRLKHCNSGNYDDCALFLAKSLRSMR